MSASLLFKPSRLVAVTVEGETRQMPEGMMLASALAATGLRVLRRSPRTGAPRGAFCLMGACQECAIHVDGALAQACMTPVREGMQIELRGAR
jgi:predicted molibdopterin-dependent oxidoreductase YjgC